ncbi:MAG: signal peptide peptidase SppA [Planctomycetota bacterium]
MKLAFAVPLLVALGTPTLRAQPASAPAEKAAPAKYAVKRVSLSGAYADLPEQGLDLASLLMGGGAPPKSFYEMLDKLDELAKAEGDAPILFDLSDGVGLNQAQLAEVERVFVKLRKAGKKTYAYLEGADSVRYQIAVQCDEIAIADMGGIDLVAPSLSISYMKDLYDLLGIHFDVLRCGEFKGAAEPYMLSRMSDHLRAHLEEMLARMNGEIVQRIAVRRGLRAERVRELQARRIWRADDARAAGLVDRIVPWAGVEKAAEQIFGRDDLAFEAVLSGKKRRKSVNPLSLLAELLNPKEVDAIEDSSLVVLHLTGPIVDGKKAQPGTLVSEPTVKLIRQVADDEKVKGVVLRVNSPGGSATASEAIRVALAELADKKPVVYSMGRVAGSGGYWITCIGQPVLAEIGTITGSIGVLGVKTNLGPLFRRAGIQEEVIALDASAEMTSPTRGWTDAEKQNLQGMIDDVYHRFLALVAKSRAMKVEEVEPLAGGRVYSGGHAAELHLVDRVGGLDEAIAMVKKAAKVDGDIEVTHLPRPRSFMDAVAEELLSVRALIPAGPVQVLLRRIGPAVGACTVLQDALVGDGSLKVWALTPDFEIRF